MMPLVLYAVSAIVGENNTSDQARQCQGETKKANPNSSRPRVLVGAEDVGLPVENRDIKSHTTHALLN